MVLSTIRIEIAEASCTNEIMPTKSLDLESKTIDERAHKRKDNLSSTI